MNSPVKLRQASTYIGALLWLVITVCLYYVSNKPFTPAIALSVLKAAWQVGIALGMLTVAGGVGNRLAPDLAVPPLVRLALQAGLGLGCLSLIFLLLGSLFGLNRWMAAGLLLAGVLFWRNIRSWLSSWGALAAIYRQAGRYEKTVGAGILLILASALLMALAPPTSFDALVYHLALPRASLLAGRLGYMPGNMFWGMPAYGSLLFTWLMLLGGANSAAVLSWSLGGLVLVGLLGYLAPLFGQRTAWVSAASLFGSYSLGLLLALAYMDWFAVFFGYGFCVAFDRWCWAVTGAAITEEQPPVAAHPTIQLGARRWLSLAGIFAGLALGTKYTSGVLVLCGLGLIVWQARSCKLALNELIKAGFLFTACALLVWLPWGIRNTLATGNPFYPLVFPAGTMDAIRLYYYQNHPVQRELWQSLALPFVATFRGVEGGPGVGASLGPLFLGLGGLAWIGWRERSIEQKATIRTAGWIIGLGVIAWAVAARLSDLLLQARLYFALAPAAAVLAGAGFTALEKQVVAGVRLGRLAGVLILLVLGLNAFQLTTQMVEKSVLPTVLGFESVDNYLAKNLSWYAAAMKAVGDLPSQAQVLMLWEPRSLYCLPRCEPDEVLDRWVHDLAVLGSPQAVIDSWHMAGFTHILYFQAGANFIRADDRRYPASIWQDLDTLLAALPAGEELGGVYTLYPLQP